MDVGGFVQKFKDLILWGYGGLVGTVIGVVLVLWLFVSEKPCTFFGLVISKDGVTLFPSNVLAFFPNPTPECKYQPSIPIIIFCAVVGFLIQKFLESRSD